MAEGSMQVTTMSSDDNKKVVASDARVFIGNLNWGISDSVLIDFMSKVGQVKYASIFKHQSGRSKVY